MQGHTMGSYSEKRQGWYAGTLKMYRMELSGEGGNDAFVFTTTPSLVIPAARRLENPTSNMINTKSAAFISEAGS